MNKKVRFFSIAVVLIILIMGNCYYLFAQTKGDLKKRIFYDNYIFKTAGLVVTDSNLLNSTTIKYFFYRNNGSSAEFIPKSIYIPTIEELEIVESKIFNNDHQILRYNISDLNSIKENFHWYFAYKDINDTIRMIIKYKKYSVLNCYKDTLGIDRFSNCYDLIEFFNMNLKSEDQLIFFSKPFLCN